MCIFLNCIFLPSQNPNYVTSLPLHKKTSQSKLNYTSGDCALLIVTPHSSCVCVQMLDGGVLMRSTRCVWMYRVPWVNADPMSVTSSPRLRSLVVRASPAPSHAPSPLPLAPLSVTHPSRVILIPHIVQTRRWYLRSQEFNTLFK